MEKGLEEEKKKKVKGRRNVGTTKKEQRIYMKG